MRFRKLFIAGISALASGTLLVGCGGSSGGDDSNGTTASFSVTDAPVDDVANVFVTFTRIDIKPSEGAPVTLELDEPRQIDLLTLQGGNAAPLIENVEVEPGEYDWLRLFINSGCADDGCQTRDESPDSMDSFVVDNSGGRIDLNLPAGAQNPMRWLHLASPFIIPAGGNADFTIDVELRKALTDPVGLDHYFLRPALRLVNNVEVGSISGSVALSLQDDDGDPTTCTSETGDSGNDVYLYTGRDADVGDINLDADGNPDHDVDSDDDGIPDEDDGISPETNPLVTAEVGDDLTYTIGFVEAGEYTITFTCQSLDDTTDDDEPIEFIQTQNVTVEAGQESEVDFTAAP